MMMRGIRGAITVDQNTSEEIHSATRELLDEIVQANDIHPEEIASVFATVTEDIDAAFPALAIRSLPGWERVPMMCAREIPVPDSIRMCIRVMLHVNTPKSQAEIKHKYLRNAAALRPDLEC